MREALCEFGRSEPAAASAAPGRSVDRVAARWPRLAILDVMARRGGSETQPVVQGNWGHGRVPVKYLIGGARPFPWRAVARWLWTWPRAGDRRTRRRQSTPRRLARASRLPRSTMSSCQANATSRTKAGAVATSTRPPFWVGDERQAGAKCEYRARATEPGAPGRPACDFFPRDGAARAAHLGLRRPARSLPEAIAAP